MSVAPLALREPDAVLAGPFWPCSVKVIRASLHGASVRVQAVGTTDGQYYDRTLGIEQFTGQVREVAGGSHQFDADPRLFRLAAEALRTHLSHSFDPQFAISVSQVDPLPHQIFRQRLDYRYDLLGEGAAHARPSFQPLGAARPCGSWPDPCPT